MKKATLSLLIVFASFTLMQTSSIFADQIDMQEIQELYETVYEVRDLELQQELIEQIKNIVYGLDLQIPNNP